MTYALIIAFFFAALFAESARARAPETILIVAFVGLVGIFLALALPPRFYRYSNEDHAANVLTRLMQRAALGSLLTLGTSVLTWFVIGRWQDAGLIGEFYLFTLLGLFLFQGFGEVFTRHIMYLQQTHQYNSNQLVAILLAVTFLLFVIIFYFLAFDLARPPEFHAYVRDLLAITLTLIGYGRAVYLMAHH